jgi:hypothetical protein
VTAGSALVIRTPSGPARRVVRETPARGTPELDTPAPAAPAGGKAGPAAPVPDGLRPDFPAPEVPAPEVPAPELPGLDVPGLDTPGLDMPGQDMPGQGSRAWQALPATDPRQAPGRRGQTGRPRLRARRGSVRVLPARAGGPRYRTWQAAVTRRPGRNALRRVRRRRCAMLAGSYRPRSTSSPCSGSDSAL